jgi:hypothetical protein
MIAKTPTGTRIEWPTVAVLGLVLTALVVVWVTGPEHRGDILAGVGAVGAVLLAVLRPMLIPPAALILAACLGASGCGASALRTHATIGTVAAVTLGGAAPLVAPACDAALTACQREPTCLAETAGRCRAASAAVDGLALVTRGYLDAIEIASMADEGAALPALMTGLSRLVVRWGEVAAYLLRFGVELPALPALASSLLGGAS